MSRALCVIAALLLTSACGRDKPASKSDPAANDAAGERSGQNPTPASDAGTLKEHMQEHFTAIREIERALVAGDLTRAQGRAAWLAAHQPHDATEAWKPHLDSVREAARALGNADNLADASRLAAALGDQCAACHLTTMAITSFEQAELPEEGPDNKSMMQRHQWAADRLWEGLIGPSESSWARGAEVLSKAPFVPATSLKDEKRQAIEKLAARVHALGSRAGSETEGKARAGLYGELLITCSSCHAIARPR